MNEETIVVAMIKDAIGGETVELRAKESFRAAIANGLVLDKDTLFRSGLTALLLSYAECSEERERINKELACIKALKMAMQGESSALVAAANDLDGSKFEAIGLMQIFNDAWEQKGW